MKNQVVARAECGQFGLFSELLPQRDVFFSLLCFGFKDFLLNFVQRVERFKLEPRREGFLNQGVEISVSGVVEYFFFVFGLRLFGVKVIVLFLSEGILDERAIVFDFGGVGHPSNPRKRLNFLFVFEDLVVIGNTNDLAYLRRNAGLMVHFGQLYNHIPHFFVVANNVKPTVFRLFDEAI